MAAAALVDSWLASSSHGYCAATIDAGDCSHGDMGSFPLPAVDLDAVNHGWTWRPAIEFCLAKCAGCARCEFVTVSIEDRDCSWYHHCELDKLKLDLGRGRFRSGRVRRTQVAEANLSIARRPQPQGAFTEVELVAQSRELQQLPVRRALRRWVERSSPVKCGTTHLGDDGDCDHGSSGVYVMKACETRSPAAGLANCLARCARCAKCNYISVRLANGQDECEWFSNCPALQIHNDEPPTSGNGDGVSESLLLKRGVRSGPAFTKAWAALLPRTFQIADPRRSASSSLSDGAEAAADARRREKAEYLFDQAAMKWAFGDELAAKYATSAGAPDAPVSATLQPFLSMESAYHHSRATHDDGSGWVVQPGSSATLVPPRAPIKLTKVPIRGFRGKGRGSREGRCAFPRNVTDEYAVEGFRPPADERLYCDEITRRGGFGGGWPWRHAGSPPGLATPWLLVGIMSGVKAIGARDAIRNTWLRADGFSSEAVGCFVLAAEGLYASPSDPLDNHWATRDVEKEAKTHNDVILLQHATEGCAGMTHSKTYEWWKWAGNALHGTSITHVLKTEDDVVLHLPNVMAAVRASYRIVGRRRASRALYLGGFAYAGYSTRAFRMCGFDWSEGGGNYKRYGCDKVAGMYPPVPFAQGPFELLSMGLIQRITADKAIADFVSRAKTHGGGGGRAAEDVLLGVWVSHVMAASASSDADDEVVHAAVDLNSLADLHCGGNKNQLMSTPPSRDQLLVHRLKTPETTAYVWEVLSCQIEHTRRACRDRACKGKGTGACADA